MYLPFLMERNEVRTMKYGEIRSNYINEEENKIYIDGWRTKTKGDEEGEVIAKINLETSEVEWIKENRKNNEEVQSAINDVLLDIENEKYK